MVNMEDIYEQLTGVDIERQKEIWDERGKGYYGEYLVFCDLYKTVKGACKILMNLNVPTAKDGTTEIDLILIHETGLYIFEVKHYKGTIYGEDTDSTWTQYFRSAPNHTFNNPINQNSYHIRAIRKIFPNIPIHSVIVFTNDECNVKVNNTNIFVDVCTLDQMWQILLNRFQKKNKILSMEKINEMFETLSVYSSMKEEVAIDGEEKSFYSWVYPIVSNLEKEREKVSKETKRLRNQKYINIAIGVLTVIVGAFLSFTAIHAAERIFDYRLKTAETNYNLKIKEFEQKFKHIDAIDNEYIKNINSYVEVSNQSLVPVTGDSFLFTYTISALTNIYGINIPQNAKYILILDDGRAIEYDLLTSEEYYNGFLYRIDPNESSKFSPSPFYGVTDVSEVAYIKIIGVQLTQRVNGPSKIILNTSHQTEHRGRTD